MQHRHLLALLQTGYTTIKVVFEKEHNVVQQPTQAAAAPKAPQPAWAGTVSQKLDRLAQMGEPVSAYEYYKTYTYKAPLSANLKPGDEVVVDSPNVGSAVARVIEVHERPQIYLDAPFTYKWIICKVDRTEYMDRRVKEEQFNDMLMECERVHQREVLLGKYRDAFPDGSDARKMFENSVKQLKGE